MDEITFFKQKDPSHVWVFLRLKRSRLSKEIMLNQCGETDHQENQCRNFMN